MNLLLDTCAVLAISQGTLPAPSASALENAGEARVSPIVPWELAIKRLNGKLDRPLPTLEWVRAVCQRHNLQGPTGGLDAALLCEAAELPPIHRDPFDRVLVATALRLDLAILTSDRHIGSYPRIQTIW